jgi:hypothetical protein
MSRHSSDLRFCGCAACRAGRRTRRNHYMIRNVRRSSRQLVRRLLRAGMGDTAFRVAVCYTD